MEVRIQKGGLEGIPEIDAAKLHIGVIVGHEIGHKTDTPSIKLCFSLRYVHREQYCYRSHLTIADGG